MAFMMPVVKNDYNIYPSCPSSRAGSGTPQSSRGSSLSSSPSGGSSFVGSPRQCATPVLIRMPKSESQNSLHRFHSKLVDKLRKTFRGKNGSSDDIHQASTSSPITIR